MPNIDPLDLSAEEEADLLTSEARARAADPTRFPNQISRPLRRRYVIQAIAIALYAGLGLQAGHLVLPTKTRAIEINGVASVLLAAALFVAAANMLSIVLDHYDRRNNEHRYESFAKATRWLGWGLVAAATVLYVVNP